MKLMQVVIKSIPPILLLETLYQTQIDVVMVFANPVKTVDYVNKTVLIVEIKFVIKEKMTLYGPPTFRLSMHVLVGVCGICFT